MALQAVGVLRVPCPATQAPLLTRRSIAGSALMSQSRQMLQAGDSIKARRSVRKIHCRARKKPLTMCAGASAIDAPGGDSEPEAQPGKNSSMRKALLFGTAGALLAGAAAWGITGISPAMAFQKFLQYGYAAAFSLVFVSEIGDKTFFMAGICAMKVGRLRAFAGAALALTAMTAISVGIGVAFKQVPEAFTSSIPIAEYLAVALLVYFGVRSLKEAWDMPSESSGEELADATETIDQAAKEGKVGGGTWKAIVEVASLVFAAEWGDRSMLAVIALAAGGSSAACVFIGALTGHFAATMIAVLGGALIGKYVSEKMIGFSGGILFLVFAVLTVAGIC